MRRESTCFPGLPACDKEGKEGGVHESSSASADATDHQHPPRQATSTLRARTKVIACKRIHALHS
jgi:hypothetical protein